VTLASESLLFLGTEKKAYLEESGSLYDITPYRRTVWLPFEVTGVDAGGLVGTVNVQIGLPFADGVVQIEQGLAATGEIGRLESITTQRFIESDVFMTGEVGTVAVFDDNNRDAEVDVFSYSVDDSTFVSDYTAAINGSVGTVTVVTISNIGD